MIFRRLFLAIALICSSLFVVVPAGHAIGGDGTTVKAFVKDLSSGDVTDAMAMTAPDFTLTMADGTSTTGPNAPTALAALPTPMTLMSFDALGNNQVSAVIQFGNMPPVAVNFTGEFGSIGAMALGAPAGP